MEHGKLWNHDYKLAQTGLGAQNHSKTNGHQREKWWNWNYIVINEYNSIG